jgi:hypothetical protein
MPEYWFKRITSRLGYFIVLPWGYTLTLLELGVIWGVEARSGC